MEPGFEIDVDEKHAILRIRGWGVWPRALAESYREAMIRAMARLRHRRWAVLSNRTGPHVQSEEVAEIVRDIMARASAAGRVRTALVVDSPTTLLQWRRIYRGNEGVQRPFSDEASAMAWLKSEAQKDLAGR
ncbi:hypothetical protein [Pendulispora albinea]|uniref:STAS/SEC14 domain-containing protein n=1 Tax=Pendulispora albinea TaxID=2741071 RepID=A0ABZ2LJC7_9BACT